MRRPSRRRALSMTPLIDVIFLLLLFFMLSSTFSRFSDVEMDLGSAGAAGGAPGELAFLRLSVQSVELNGRPVALETLAAAVTASGAGTLVVSLGGEVTAQRLTDLLVALRRLPEVDLVVLEEA